MGSLTPHTFRLHSRKVSFNYISFSAVSGECHKWDLNTIKDPFTIIPIASDIKSIQWSCYLRTQRRLKQVFCDSCAWLLSACLSPPSAIYSHCAIKSDALQGLLTKFFSEPHASRSSASYPLSFGIITQTILFKGLQVARVENCTVLRRYFCLMVLEPKVERENDFINRHGTTLVRLE
jgi:hypothetical protein